LQLQQALVTVDEHGDGFIGKEQFIQAFYKAGMELQRDLLEFLFDMMAQTYNTKGERISEQEKVLSITYFIKELFYDKERKELDDLDTTLMKIKEALIYKGLDLAVVFSDTSEATSKKERGAQKKQQKGQPLDLTVHYSKFAQQLVKDEFCSRLESLHLKNVSAIEIRKLASFLSLNQRNESVIYLNCWLHHLKRVGSQFHKPDERVMPIMCSKLLRNRTVFRSLVESTSGIRSKVDAEKVVEPADLRQVLTKFGISLINQDVFITEISGNRPIHIDDLMTNVENRLYNEGSEFGRMQKMKAQQYYQQSADEAGEIEEMHDLKKADYFDKV